MTDTLAREAVAQLASSPICERVEFSDMFMEGHYLVDSSEFITELVKGKLKR